MKSWDVVIVGGGLIGLSLALELRRGGAEVLIVEKGEVGQEASWAGGGMIGYCDPQLDARLGTLAYESARLYPQFVKAIEEEAQTRVDFRTEGTIMLLRPGDVPLRDGEKLTGAQVREMEPLFDGPAPNPYFVPEPAVNPRLLTAAAAVVAKKHGVDIVSGSPVTEIITEHRHSVGVRTGRADYHGKAIVNCAGAWASQIKGPAPAPTIPAKGHMLYVAKIDPQGGPHTPLLRYVIRHPQSVYLIPRSDGRVLIGSTLEGAGYDKRVQPSTIQRLHQQGANLVPELGQARMLESWTGLRPGTPDNLPLIGATAAPGYYLATGHFRDGILLAPITAKVMADVLAGRNCGYDLSVVSPQRFR